jgi:hypothetical protein
MNKVKDGRFLAFPDTVFVGESTVSRELQQTWIPAFTGMTGFDKAVRKKDDYDNDNDIKETTKTPTLDSEFWLLTSHSSHCRGRETRDIGRTIFILDRILRIFFRILVSVEDVHQPERSLAWSRILKCGLPITRQLKSKFQMVR